LIGIQAVKLTAKDPVAPLGSVSETSSASCIQEDSRDDGRPPPGVFVEGSHAHWFGHFDLRPGGDVHAVRVALSQVSDAAARRDVNVVFGFSAGAWALLRPGHRRPGH
jgi:hypothetical protein